MRTRPVIGSLPFYVTCQPACELDANHCVPGLQLFQLPYRRRLQESPVGDLSPLPLETVGPAPQRLQDLTAVDAALGMSLVAKYGDGFGGPPPPPSRHWRNTSLRQGSSFTERVSLPADLDTAWRYAATTGSAGTSAATVRDKLYPKCPFFVVVRGAAGAAQCVHAGLCRARSCAGVSR